MSSYQHIYPNISSKFQGIWLEYIVVRIEWFEFKTNGLTHLDFYWHRNRLL